MDEVTKLEPITSSLGRFAGDIESTLTGLVSAAAENKAFVTVNVTVHIDGRDVQETTIES
jgi:hypothetical protein